jgi:hypothetical protein
MSCDIYVIISNAFNKYMYSYSISRFSSSERWPFQYASLQAIATYATITNGLIIGYNKYLKFVKSEKVFRKIITARRD